MHAMFRITKLAGCVLLLLLATLAGTAAAVAAFFGAAHLTSSVALLALSGALALVLITGGLSRLAVHGLMPGMRTLRTWLPAGITCANLLVVGLVASALVFEPMDVTYAALEPTEDTRYWELSSGSRLAYMHVAAEGAPHETPLVVLHGGPGAPSPLVPTPADRLLATSGFDVYHYHQLGAGLSKRLDAVTQYTVERHVEDLEAIRQQIGAERLVLIGGSWGGTLAAHYMAAHPDNVERTVFASPGAIWSPGWSEAGWGSDGSEVDALMEAITPRFGVVYYLQQINPRAAQNLASDEEMSGFLQSVAGEIIARDIAGPDKREDESGARLEIDPVTPRGFGYYAMMFTMASIDETDDPRPVLTTLETPVLILRGEYDRIVPEVAAEYQEIFRNSTLVVVDGVGHAVGSASHYPDLIRAFLLAESLPIEHYEN